MIVGGLVLAAVYVGVLGGNVFANVIRDEIGVLVCSLLGEGPFQLVLSVLENR